MKPVVNMTALFFKKRLIYVAQYCLKGRTSGTRSGEKRGRSETPPVQRYVFPGADADSRSVSGAPGSALF